MPGAPLPRRGGRAAHPQAGRGRPHHHPAHPPPRPGARRRQGRAAHHLAVRLAARAVHPRRPPARRGPQPRRGHPGRDAAPVLRRASAPTTSATPPAPRCWRPRSGWSPRSGSRPCSSSSCSSAACGRWRPGTARARAGAGLLPAALPRRRRLRARPSTCCARCGRQGRTGGSTRRWAGCCAPTCRLPGSASPAPETVALLGRPARRRLAGRRGRRARHRREASGLVAAFVAWHLERALRSLAATSSGSTDRVRLARQSRRRAVRVARPRTRPARAPPGVPRELVPAARRGRHGRQRPLGQASAGCRARRATSRASTRCSTSSRAPSRSGVKAISAYAFSTENWSRSPEEVRFLMGFNRDVIRRRRDEMHELGVRVRWAGPGAAAVALGDQGAAGRRGADPRTTTCSR